VSMTTNGKPYALRDSTLPTPAHPWTLRWSPKPRAGMRVGLDDPGDPDAE